jgi:hypothetical protein
MAKNFDYVSTTERDKFKLFVNLAVNRQTTKEDITKEFTKEFLEFIELTKESFKVDFLKLKGKAIDHFGERYCIKTSEAFVSYVNYSFFRKQDLENHIYKSGIEHDSIVQVFDMLQNKPIKLRVRLITLKEIRES